MFFLHLNSIIRSRTLYGVRIYFATLPFRIVLAVTVSSPNEFVKLCPVRKKYIKLKSIKQTKNAHCSADALAAAAAVQGSNDILSLIANINNLEREGEREREHVLHNTYRQRDSFNILSITIPLLTHAPVHIYKNVNLKKIIIVKYYIKIISEKTYYTKTYDNEYDDDDDNKTKHS